MVENGKRRSSRGPLIWLAQGAITLAFVGWLVSRIDSTTIETIKAVSAPAFCTAVLIYSLSQFWCAARLRILIANGEKLPGLPRFLYLVRLTLSTFFISNFLPGTDRRRRGEGGCAHPPCIAVKPDSVTLLLDRLTNVAAALASERRHCRHCRAGSPCEGACQRRARYRAGLPACRCYCGPRGAGAALESVRLCREGPSRIGAELAESSAQLSARHFSYRSRV